MLKNKLLNTLILSVLSVPGLAFADDAPAAPAAATAPTPAVTSNVALVSNYLYRGISQSGNNPALQGGFDYAHASGFYAGFWGSSISWLGDEYVAGTTASPGAGAYDAGMELDTYLGFKNSFATDFSYDVGYLRYNYPGNYAIGATKADTDELYALIGYKWFTLKYSDSISNLFGTPNSTGSTYIDLSASYAIGDSGFTLGAHAGRQNIVGSTADASRAAGADPSYSDYKLSVTKDFSGSVVGLAYSTTTAEVGAGQVYHVQGKDLGRGTAVLSLARTF